MSHNSRGNGIQKVGSFPSKEYCVVGPLKGAVVEVKAVARGKDQGWGNTGHSRIDVAVLDGSTRAIKANKAVMSTTHSYAEKKVTWSAEDAAALFDAAKPGDYVAVLVVSASYPGFACKCSRATLEVTTE